MLDLAFLSPHAIPQLLASRPNSRPPSGSMPHPPPSSQSRGVVERGWRRRSIPDLEGEHRQRQPSAPAAVALRPPADRRLPPPPLARLPLSYPRLPPASSPPIRARRRCLLPSASPACRPPGRHSSLAPRPPPHIRACQPPHPPCHKREGKE